MSRLHRVQNIGSRCAILRIQHGKANVAGAFYFKHKIWDPLTRYGPHRPRCTIVSREFRLKQQFPPAIASRTHPPVRLSRSMPPPRGHCGGKQLPDAQETPSLIDFPRRTHPQSLRARVEFHAVAQRTPPATPRPRIDRICSNRGEAGGRDIRPLHLRERIEPQDDLQLHCQALQELLALRPPCRKGCSRRAYILPSTNLCRRSPSARVRRSSERI